MTKKQIHLACATPGIVWLLGFLFVALKGYTIQDTFHQMAGLMAGLALGLVYLILLIFVRTRRTAGISLILLLAAVPSILAIREYRLKSAIRKLEAIHAEITSHGQPFPNSIDPLRYKGPGCIRWYYQKHSDTSFAIVYTVSSNSYAMEYPGSQWRYINYQPDGYVREQLGE